MGRDIGDKGQEFIPIGCMALGCFAWTLSGSAGSAWPLTVMAGRLIDWESTGDIFGVVYVGE